MSHFEKIHIDFLQQLLELLGGTVDLHFASFPESLSTAAYNAGHDAGKTLGRRLTFLRERRLERYARPGVLRRVSYCDHHTSILTDEEGTHGHQALFPPSSPHRRENPQPVDRVHA
jgi:hypothetical protein